MAACNVNLCLQQPSTGIKPFWVVLIVSFLAAQCPRRFASIEAYSLAMVLLREIRRQFVISDFSPFLCIRIVTDLPHARGMWPRRCTALKTALRAHPPLSVFFHCAQRIPSRPGAVLLQRLSCIQTSSGINSSANIELIMDSILFSKYLRNTQFDHNKWTPLKSVFGFHHILVTQNNVSYLCNFQSSHIYRYCNAGHIRY